MHVPHLRSFRARLTLRWTLSFGVLLALANLAIYAAADTYLWRDLDAKVRTVAATELASSTDRADIHLHELPAAALGQGEYTAKVVQILESDGRVRLSSDALSGLGPLVTPETVALALRGEAPMVTLEVGSRRVRAAVLRATQRGTAFAVLVGLYADAVDTQLAELGWLLAGLWVVTLSATALLGHRLASAALAPVVAITRRAARIARGEFSARLDPRDTDDEVGQMTRSLNDVLERLHAALEVNRRFASDASHELRGPITAMAGEIDVTLKHPRTPDEYREALALVRERLDALTALTADLMLLVRAQEGTQGMPLREVTLVPAVHEAAARVAPLARSRSVRVEATAMPPLVAYAEPRLLARVLDNLLANAVQYNRTGGLVTVTGEAEDVAPDEWQTGWVVVRITDTGHGITSADRERVFERFYRPDQSRARHTGGSGLGLAICREVIGALGGTIRIAESSDRGTTVEVRLPGRPGEGAPLSGSLVTPVVRTAPTVH